MKVYLVRHGDYDRSHTEKPLSEKGIEETGRVAGFLKDRKCTVSAIWHSTKKRARQSAEIMAVACTCNHVEEKDTMAPLDSVEGFPAEIHQFGKDIMLVGHLPFLSNLLSLILTGSQDPELVEFSPSTVVCLEDGRISYVLHPWMT